MVTLREAAQRIDPTTHQISVRALAYKVIMVPPIYVRRLIKFSLGWARLNFIMQNQQQTNWCWAATSVSVSRFFNPNGTWTQCSLVNAELGRSDCCMQGASSNCNRAWYLDNALSRTGNLQSTSSGSASITEIAGQINANRPICVRIGWSGGGGHFLAIDGYNSAISMVAVDDPWYGASDVVLSVFQTAYQGSGSWTTTYRVHD
jgi:hypothetical protein